MVLVIHMNRSLMISWLMILGNLDEVSMKILDNGERPLNIR